MAMSGTGEYQRRFLLRPLVPQPPPYSFPYYPQKTGKNKKEQEKKSTTQGLVKTDCIRAELH
jgi:hypothetical protein